MKPSIIRNRTIFKASLAVKSRLLCSHLTKDLQNKYSRRSVRVTEGDTVRVMRGEYKGVSGKIIKVSSEKNGVAVEGIKREKLKGGNVDVFIHPSNLLITDLNTEDKWRQNKLEGKHQKSKETKPKEEKPKTTPQKEAKQEVKQEKPKENKESKTAKNAKKEDK
ncbi:MAG TPA: 50S ribosomal protein L24 [Candidatus Nitrosotenuis sp.]|jgi:large subunit ribosomal protein L24